MRRIQYVLAVATVVVAGLSPSLMAQGATATQADIERLQDNVVLTERDITQVQGRDAALATRLKTELDALNEEVIYLKVKLRKERSLARGEYLDVLDRLDNLRSRARGASATASAPAPAPRPAAQPTPRPAA